MAIPTTTLSYAERRWRAAELEVKDARLVIRLKIFLRLQGVQEAESDVQFFEGSRSGCAEDEEQPIEQEEDENEDEDCSGDKRPAHVPARPVRYPLHYSSPNPSIRQRCSVLLTSYMIALLHMKHRIRPACKGFDGVGSGSCNGKQGLGRGLRSGLRTCAWTADEDSEGWVQGMEEEYHPSSVADFYAGIDY
ncbi:hypothetical protein CVT25_013662 [Psilocybe cyanescens]|uniref:Uncharacterized protein n=1 Tax=Psilocybe cyanescens TaxID=93625 RepID=A0A409WTD9_PSICY|nr:hypothetical protein CVT25_013662 [Psilocybe cyanescens]